VCGVCVCECEICPQGQCHMASMRESASESECLSVRVSGELETTWDLFIEKGKGR
jgi:hypothetical protein